MVATTGKTAQGLGVAGGLRLEIARALLARGWRVRALVRDPALAGPRLTRRGLDPRAIEMLRGDALRPLAALRAAEGCAAVIHAAKPDGFLRWREDGVAMLAHVLTAAEAAGARLAFPAISTSTPPIRARWWTTGLIDPTAREAVEMRWLWGTAIRPCDARLRARIGAPPRTPLAKALALMLRPDAVARAA